MGSFESDFILRAVEQMARAIARIFRLKQEQRFDEAERAVADAYLDLFGIDPRFFPLMDARTVAEALGHPKKVAAFAELLGEEAAIAEARGDQERAAFLQRRRGELQQWSTKSSPAP